MFAQGMWLIGFLALIIVGGIVVVFTAMMIIDAISHAADNRRRNALKIAEANKFSSPSINAYYWAMGFLGAQPTLVGKEALAGAFSDWINPHQLDDLDAAFDDWLNSLYQKETKSRAELLPSIAKLHLNAGLKDTRPD